MATETQAELAFSSFADKMASLSSSSNSSISIQHSSRTSSRSSSLPSLTPHSPWVSNEFQDNTIDQGPQVLLHMLLESSSTVPDTSNNDDHLLNSIEVASEDERAFALKAASSSRLLKAWFADVSAWHWPGGFEVPGSVQLHALVEKYKDTQGGVRDADELDCVAVEGYWVSFRTVRRTIPKGCSHTAIAGVKC